MTIYNLGNIKGEKGDKGDSVTGPTGPVGVGIKSIEQITYRKFKFCLTDGSEYIINYSDEPTFDGITISSDKDIISTGETATITAQLTSQGQPASVSGETVTFEVRKQSDDSLIETLSDVTDDTGVATVSYLGQGTGDIYIKADCRILSETYEIKDAIKYIQGSVATGALSNITGIPTNFKCTFKVKQTSTSGSFIGITIGTDSSNRILFGKTGSNGQLGIYVYNNSSSVASATQNSVYQTNVEAETVYTYEDGVQTITANNVTKTLTNSSITGRSYNYIEVANSQCFDLIIEPL